MMAWILFFFLKVSVAWSRDPATGAFVCSSIFSSQSLHLKSWEYYHVMTNDHRLISNARYLGASTKNLGRYDFLDINGSVHSVPMDSIKTAHPTGPGVPSKSWYNKFLHNQKIGQGILDLAFDKPWFQNIQHTEFEGHLLHASSQIPKEAMIQFQKDLHSSLEILQNHDIQLPQIHFHLGYSGQQGTPHVYAYEGLTTSSKKEERTLNILWKIVWPLRHIQHHLSTLFHELFHLWIKGQPLTPVLNEALADFMAAHLLNTPKISPGFWKNQNPARDISTLEAFENDSSKKISKELPKDNLFYMPNHFPSLLISHLLWEARSTLNPTHQEAMFQFIYQRIFHHYGEYKSLRSEYRASAADSEFYYDIELISALLIQFSDQHLSLEFQKIFLEKIKSLVIDYHFDLQLLRQLGRSFELKPSLQTDIH